MKQGYNLTYLITSVNLGPNSASDVGISDVLPPGTSFVRALYRKVSCSLYNGQVACSIPSTGTPCSFDGNTVSCSVGTLAPFSLKNPTGVAVVLVVKATAPAGTIMKNTATVTASNPDPNSKNNVATANTKITK